MTMTATMKTEGAEFGPFTVISDRDRPLCHLALTLLRKQIKAAKEALASLRLDDAAVLLREAEADFLSQCLDGNVPSLGLPGHLLPALRAGLAIELDRVAKLQKAQLDLLVGTDDTSDRIKQLDRLLSDLDVAQMQEAAA